jgi:hypothetical protein
VKSGPGEARTILLLHIISVRPSKQPLMVRTFLKVYMELGSYFLFLQEQIKDIIIMQKGELHTGGQSLVQGRTWPERARSLRNRDPTPAVRAAAASEPVSAAVAAWNPCW